MATHKVLLVTSVITTTPTEQQKDKLISERVDEVPYKLMIHEVSLSMLIIYLEPDAGGARHRLVHPLFVNK